MIEFLEFRRNPLAPTIFVNKAAGIYRINSDLIKVTFAVTAPAAGGIPDTTETINLIWPMGDWHEARRPLSPGLRGNPPRDIHDG